MLTVTTIFLSYSVQESLADMLKRALSEDDGGGKKKNKQPNPVGPATSHHHSR